MPKEIFWGPTPSDEDPRDSDKLVAQVSWARDMYVQVGLVPTGDPEGSDVGLFADLTRQQINDFIRALRKARDQAYGRDE